MKPPELGGTMKKSYGPREGEPKTLRFEFALGPSLRSALARFSARSGRAEAGIVREAVAEYLGRRASEYETR
jgi:hypothetical protein